MHSKVLNERRVTSFWRMIRIKHQRRYKLRPFGFILTKNNSHRCYKIVIRQTNLTVTSMLVTYNFVTKSEQGHLTTGNMLRMLISGGIFIKHTDVPTVFFRIWNFCLVKINIFNKKPLWWRTRPLRRNMCFNDGSRSVYHRVNPIILFYNVNWDKNMVLRLYPIWWKLM